MPLLLHGRVFDLHIGMTKSAVYRMLYSACCGARYDGGSIFA